MTDRISSNKSIAKSRRFDRLFSIKTEGSNLGALKTLMILFLFLIEIATMVVAGLFVASFIRWYMVFAGVMSLAACIYVLSSNKNSQSKAVWVMFLLIFFEFGYIVFYLSDEHFFFRKQRKRYKAIFERVDRFQMGTNPPKNLPLEVRRDIDYFANAGNFACYTKTKIEYYSSGAKLFDSVLEKMEKAEKFIFMEFFIISDGALMKRFEEIAEKKCSEGVEIRIIYDDMGSHRTFSRKTRKRLEKLGVKIFSFNQLISWFSFGLNYRNHRKIIVVDGKFAWTGGANFADEYINEKRMHGYWKDCGVKLEGAAVDGLTLSFLKQWEFVSKTLTEVSPYTSLFDQVAGSAVVVPFADGLDYAKPIGRDAYANIISNAKQKLYIMTPYFIPDDVIFTLLKNKVDAGVDVRLVMPEVPDKKAVYRVSRNNAEKLAEMGVKLYTMNKSFVHSKLVLTENAAIVGSINFDLRSFYQQFENAIYTNDPQVLKDILSDFENTFKVSTLLKKDKFYRASRLNRVIAGMLGIIAPFM